ncbi:hypothetical protein HMPREF1275_00915 [Propionibacterium sp. KPL1844]|nr:hypothetical protein HMPREF1275_00915 [Propionibacterium sp. KPL1844]
MAKTDRPRVLLDSCAVLAWIKGEPEAQVMGSLLQMIDAGDAQLVVSAGIFAEVFKPAPEGATWQPVMDAVLNKLRSRDVEIVDVTEPVATSAAKLRLAHHMKAMDAIHLATASKNRCDWLVTKDHDFPELTGNVQVWDVFRTPASHLPWVRLTEPMQPDLFDAVDGEATQL